MGTELSPGLGPIEDRGNEREFIKHVYGTFTGSKLGAWLEGLSIDAITIVGFYTHGCVSTTSREAIMLNFNVLLDPNGTGSCEMEHELLGRLTADESRRAALLQLENMGAHITSMENERIAVAGAVLQEF